MGYQPALDGLRALAVLAVIAYHYQPADPPLAGGFLGVEVFFVVSGYLITSLLIEEQARSGRIDLKGFWIRRARRLLPALITMLVVTTTYAVLFVDDATHRLRGDLLGALTYVSNWWQLASGQSYFEELGRPPLLRHLWSLAVEEQWYVLWPLVAAAGLAWAGRQVNALAVPILCAAALSVTAMVVQFDESNPSAVYLGTHTRAAGLLIGAALATVWRPWRFARAGQRHLVGLDAAGAIGLVMLAAACIWVDRFGYLTIAEGWGPVLYRGGFVVISLLSAMVIAVAVHPGARLIGAALSHRWLTEVGTRSYGLYLWHWPVFTVLRAEDVGRGGIVLLAIRVVVTVAISEACYQFVEQPIRRGALSRWWSDARAGIGQARQQLQVGGALAGVLVVALAVPLVRAEPVDLFVGGDDVAAPSLSSTSTTQVAVAGPVPDEGSIVVPPDPNAASTTSGVVDGGAVSSTVAPSGPLPRRVTVVGDSQARALVANAPDLTGRLELSNGAVEGCGLADRGRIVTSASYRRSFDECAGWPAKWAAAAGDNQAQVVLVVLGAWDVFDRTEGDVTIAFGTPEADAYLSGQLRAGIQAVRATGARVALLEVPCMRPIAAGGLDKLPERGEDQRVAHLNDLLRSAAAEDPANVFFVPGPVQWCTDEAVATDVNLRWDGVHYYKPGSQLVFDTISGALIAL